jgi:hypothetical protein
MGRSSKSGHRANDAISTQSKLLQIGVIVEGDTVDTIEEKIVAQISVQVCQKEIQYIEV